MQCIIILASDFTTFIFLMINIHKKYTFRVCVPMKRTHHDASTKPSGQVSYRPRPPRLVPKNDASKCGDHSDLTHPWKPWPIYWWFLMIYLFKNGEFPLVHYAKFPGKYAKSLGFLHQKSHQKSMKSMVFCARITCWSSSPPLTPRGFPRGCLWPRTWSCGQVTSWWTW